MKDLFSLKGKVAIVTGGNTGIGYGIAHGFASVGSNIVIAARNQDKIDKSQTILRSLQSTEVGLRRDEIRAASQAMHLPTWNKPAKPCPTTGFPYRWKVTEEVLGRIESAEYALKGLGFAQCCVCDHHPVARIEFFADDLPAVVESRMWIVEAFRSIDYTYFTLDLEGFRMNDIFQESITRSDDASS